jgi:hypothetical protein
MRALFRIHERTSMEIGIIDAGNIGVTLARTACSPTLGVHVVPDRRPLMTETGRKAPTYVHAILL